jgi:DnaJ family protein A protein 2
MKEHPDKGGDPEKFRALKEASEILSDPEKRELYNQYGMEGVKAGGRSQGRRRYFRVFQGAEAEGA